MNTSFRLSCLPIVALAAVGLAGCGSSSKPATQAQGGSTSTLVSSPSSTAPSLTASATPTTLSKTEFLAKMNAVCVDFNTKIQQLPQPSDAEDYAAIAANIQGTVTLLPQYIKQAETLVARSADKEALTDNWLTVEKSDFVAFAPAAKKFVTDAKAKNAAKLQADGKELDAAPDHSEAIAGFMSGYGLKSCAILERS
jgi:hypothetical protein